MPAAYRPWGRGVSRQAASVKAAELLHSLSVAVAAGREAVCSWLDGSPFRFAAYQANNMDLLWLRQRSDVEVRAGPGCTVERAQLRRPTAHRLRRGMPASRRAKGPQAFALWPFL